MLFRSLLALFLLAGTVLPSVILFSIPALAEDGGGDGGDGGADGSGGGAVHGNCGATSDDPGGCGGCGDTSGGFGDAGFDGGGNGGGGDGGGGFWTDEGSTPVTNWTPILETTRFILPVCGVHTAQGIGVGNRTDSTFAPGWGGCRR